jgi:hypothetical protein
MDIEFHAIIKISLESKLALSKLLNYVSNSGIKVELSNHDKEDNVFIAKLRITSENIDDAQEICELELVRLTNILSWEHNLKIIEFRINGHQYSQKIVSQNAVFLAETIHMADSISIKKIINSRGMDIMKKSLEKEIDYNLLDILTMWREAIADKSSTSKFFQLYRLMEFIQGTRANVDDWILEKVPNVTKKISRKRGKDDEVSIYTYLRDNIHYKKENKFPYKEIKDNVIAFECLVKEAINEKYIQKPTN